MFNFFSKNILIIALLIVVQSCNNDQQIKRPDVTSIPVDIKIDRFDSKLIGLDKSKIPAFNTKWQQDYPFFYSDYLREMLEIGTPKDSTKLYSLLASVLESNDFKALNKAVGQVFPNLNQQERELTIAFKYIKYYYPKFEIPRVIAFVGGFSYQTPIGEDYIGIGLDMFLGADSPFYQALVNSIPLYVSRRFTPDNIAPRVIETILREELLEPVEPTFNTLELMIYNGKLLYAMDVLLPSVKDEHKIGYNEQQLTWSKQYQKDIWAWFIEENLLYNNDYNRIYKYFSEAPFTPELGINNESSPKLGSYIGWMIVRKYMERNPEVPLNELLENTNAQLILKESNFRG